MHRRLLSSPKRILALVGTLSLASLGLTGKNVEVF